MITALRRVHIVHQPIHTAASLRYKTTPLYFCTTSIGGIHRAHLCSPSKANSWLVPVSSRRTSVPPLSPLQFGIRRASGQPWAERGKSAQSKSGLSGYAVDKLKAFFRRTLIFKILVAIPLALGFQFATPWLYEKYRFWRIKHAIFASQELASSHIPGGAVVQRPYAKKMIQNIVDSAPDGLYDVMIGPHGTGKSTLVKQIAAENAGVIYICVPNVEGQNIGAEFTKSFAKTISWRPAGPGFIDAIIKAALNGPIQATDQTLVTMFEDFDKAAKSYYQEHNCSITLIIDEINLLARLDPDFLRRLLLHAKKGADQANYKIILVCSDGIVPAQLKQHTSSSRADTLYIGDFTTPEVMEYLVKTNIEQSSAKRIADFTGNRIIDVRRIVRRLRRGVPLDEIFDGMKVVAWGIYLQALRQAPASGLETVCKTLFEDGPVDESEFYKLCGGEGVGQTFLDLNIFAVVPTSRGDAQIWFGSKIMEKTIHEHLVKMSGC